MSTELVHKHIILRIEANLPPTEEELREWMVSLVDKIDMKILAGPISGNIDYMPGNNGPTCAVIIETSHMACHVWNDVSPALIQLDVYTCGPFDPEHVLDHIKVWDPVKVEHKYLDRENNLETIGGGIINS
jgi:S-adenosylmethionine/arginine decarboxylase-like enzyme